MTPKKYPQNLNTPQKMFIFLKTQKNIEIQNFEPQKNGPSLRLCENIRVPPPPPPPPPPNPPPPFGQPLRLRVKHSNTVLCS